MLMGEKTVWRQRLKKSNEFPHRALPAELGFVLQDLERKTSKTRVCHGRRFKKGRRRRKGKISEAPSKPCGPVVLGK